MDASTAVTSSDLKTDLKEDKEDKVIMFLLIITSILNNKKEVGIDMHMLQKVIKPSSTTLQLKRD